MKRGFLQMLMLFLVGMWLLGASSAFAAPPPEWVKEQKDKAPLHITGTVKEVVSVRDESGERGFPAETRKMNLTVDTIVKKPDDLALQSGGTLAIFYFWYPQSVPMTGPGRVSVVPGDQIEVWLQKDDDGWTPIVAGSTVNFLKKVEPRDDEQGPTLKQRTESAWHNYWPVIVFLALAGGVYALSKRKSIRF